MTVEFEFRDGRVGLFGPEFLIAQNSTPEGRLAQAPNVARVGGAAVGAVQEIAGRLEAELGIAGFDDQGVAVSGDALEGPGLIEGAVVLEELVEADHAHKGRDAGEENGQFEGDGDVGGK